MSDTINPEIIVTAKDEASKVLNGVADSADKTGRSISDVARSAVIPLGAAFATVTGIVGTSIAAFAESQDTLTQLDAVLKSTHGASGLLRQDFIDQASALQQLTKFSDEQILSSSNLLLTFTQIKGPIMQQAIQTTLDMSQALGQDLKSSAIQLGKALNDPITGITALRRVGVSFTESQQDLITSLVKSGDLEKAQTLILQELQKEFGGSAVAAGQTFSGQLTILKNNINDLQETIGQGLVQVLGQMFGGMDKLSAKLQQLNQFLQAHKDIVAAVAVALLVLVVTFGVLLVAALVIVAGTVGLVVGAIGLLVAIVAAVATLIIFHWNEIKTKTEEIWNAIVAKVQEVWNTIKNFIQTIIDQIKAVVQAGLDIIKTIWQDAVTAILLILDVLTGGMVTKTLDGLIKMKGFWEDHKAQVIAVVNALKDAIGQALDGMVEHGKSKISELQNNFTTGFNAMKDAAETAMNAIKAIVDVVLGIIENKINNFHPSINIGIQLPDIEGAWNSMKARARSLGIPGFAVGGVVPGPIGAPTLALVHGGETVVPNRGGQSQASGNGSGGVNLNVYVGLYAGSEIEKRNIAEQLFGSLQRVAQSQNKSVGELLGI